MKGALPISKTAPGNCNNQSIELQATTMHVRTATITLNSFINTKKAFKKLYIFILRLFELFLIHLQSKNLSVD